MNKWIAGLLKLIIGFSIVMIILFVFYFIVTMPKQVSFLLLCWAGLFGCYLLGDYVFKILQEMYISKQTCTKSEEI